MPLRISLETGSVWFVSQRSETERTIADNKFKRSGGDLRGSTGSQRLRAEDLIKRVGNDREKLNAVASKLKIKWPLGRVSFVQTAAAGDQGRIGTR
jgi:hypothetical protein